MKKRTNQTDSFLPIISFQSAARAYETFKSIISVFMKEISELDKLPELYYSPQFGELVYKDGREEMHLVPAGIHQQKF